MLRNRLQRQLLCTGHDEDLRSSIVDSKHARSRIGALHEQGNDGGSDKHNSGCQAGFQTKSPAVHQHTLRGGLKQKDGWL